VIHAQHVRQHVADPVTALREMVRVRRPGDVVAVRDGDYSGFMSDTGASAAGRASP
jgi:hypothetical protein